MSEPTANAKAFMKANDKSVVVSGAAHGEGRGGTYTLKSGRSFRLSLEDCRSLPEGYPDWGLNEVQKINDRIAELQWERERVLMSDDRAMSNGSLKGIDKDLLSLRQQLEELRQSRD